MPPRKKEQEGSQSPPPNKRQRPLPSPVNQSNSASAEGSPPSLAHRLHVEQSSSVHTNLLESQDLELDEHSSNTQVSPALPLDLSRSSSSWTPPVRSEQSSSVRTNLLQSQNLELDEHSSNNQVSPALPLDLSRSSSSWTPPVRSEQSSSVRTNLLDSQQLELPEHSSNNQLYPALLSLGPDGAFLSTDSNQWVPLSFSSGVQNPGKSFLRRMIAAFCRNDCQSPQPLILANTITVALAL
jgi:hypothetical protein